MSTLYNKYRPTKFDELVGQDHITKVIEYQLKNYSLPHSLILYGPSGTGKTTLARLIASDLNESEYGTFERDSALEATKEDIKNLQLEIDGLPFFGEYKTYIFDEAHEISQKAWNSLLKIIEEPPRHVKFIFSTTEFYKIPLTIKTRSQCHHFLPIKLDTVQKRLRDIIKLEKLDIPEDLVDLIVYSSNGSLRTAIMSLETVVSAVDVGESLKASQILGLISTKDLSEFIRAYLFSKSQALFNLKTAFLADEVNLNDAVSQLQQLIMDFRFYLSKPALKSQLRSNVEYLGKLIEKENKESDKPLEKRAIQDKLDSLYDNILAFEEDMKRATNKDALFLRLLVKLLKNPNA